MATPCRRLPQLTDEDVARFWRKVNKSDGCWLWNTHKFRNGYGKFMKCKAQYGAHRIAFMIQHGYDPGQILVCHTCDDHACVRGDHLFLGTHKDNSGDMKAKGRSATGDKNGMRTHPHRTSPGEKNGYAKLTDAQVREICRVYDAGEADQYELADRFGVWQMTISRIVRRVSRQTAHART